MANKYIRLADSEGTIDKRFRVVHGGYRVIDTKAMQVGRTIGGQLDVAVGDVYTTHEYIIRVRHTEPDTNYGTLAQLNSLFKLNNPLGTPSNVLDFWDHANTYKTCYMAGDFDRQILSIMVDGENAWYFVQVVLLEIPT